MSGKRYGLFPRDCCRPRIWSSDGHWGGAVLDCRGLFGVEPSRSRGCEIGWTRLVPAEDGPVGEEANSGLASTEQYW